MVHFIKVSISTHATFTFIQEYFDLEEIDPKNNDKSTVYLAEFKFIEITYNLNFKKCFQSGFLTIILDHKLSLKNSVTPVSCHSIKV